jgi:hypothetical protein
MGVYHDDSWLPQTHTHRARRGRQDGERSAVKKFTMSTEGEPLQQEKPQQLPAQIQIEIQVEMVTGSRR